LQAFLSSFLGSFLDGVQILPVGPGHIPGLGKQTLHLFLARPGG
jgi:hypothetical protein